MNQCMHTHHMCTQQLHRNRKAHLKPDEPSDHRDCARIHLFGLQRTI